MSMIHPSIISCYPRPKKLRKSDVSVPSVRLPVILSIGVRGGGEIPNPQVLEPVPLSVQGPSLDMFKLVQLGPHCTGHLFKIVWSASGGWEAYMCACALVFQLKI